MGQVTFQFGGGLGGLAQADVQVHQALAYLHIVRLEGAKLFEDAYCLPPVKALHVDVGHALEQFDIPGAVGAALLGKTQRRGVGLARHVEFGETVVDVGQVEVFPDGFVHQTAGGELVDQPCTHRQVHWRDLHDAPQDGHRLGSFTAHAVGLGHDRVLGNGFRGAAFLDQQVTYQGMQGQIGGSEPQGLEGLVHGGAQVPVARQRTDTSHRFDDLVGLRLGHDLGQRQGRHPFVRFGQLFARLAYFRPPVGAQQELLDVFAQTFLGGHIGLGGLGFDERLV